MSTDPSRSANSGASAFRRCYGDAVGRASALRVVYSRSPRSPSVGPRCRGLAGDCAGTIGDRCRQDGRNARRCPHASRVLGEGCHSRGRPPESDHVRAATVLREAATRACGHVAALGRRCACGRAADGATCHRSGCLAARDGARGASRNEPEARHWSGPGPLPRIVHAGCQSHFAS
jgi:hypothetical protein